MDAHSAIEALDTISSLKPGWSIDVEDHGNRFQDTVKVTIHYPAANSDREFAPEFATPILPDARASFVIQVGPLTDALDLYRRMVEIFVVIETHEHREFLRVGSDYDAPFHPHRTVGMARWGDVTGDLNFGLA